MQPHETVMADEQVKRLQDKVYEIGQEMRRLNPGDLAALRRTADTPMRAPHYWRWKSRFGWSGAQDETWAYIITFMAILTQKGHPKEKDKPSPHDGKNSLGKALCDGGFKDWAGQDIPRPVVSEQRLARFLNATPASRGPAALRLARVLAKSQTPVNCTDLAWFLIDKKRDKAVQKIAQDYYRFWDQAERRQAQKDGKDA